jgi:hypothetical protein
MTRCWLCMPAAQQLLHSAAVDQWCCGQVSVEAATDKPRYPMTLITFPAANRATTLLKSLWHRVQL